MYHFNSINFSICGVPQAMVSSDNKQPRAVMMLQQYCVSKSYAGTEEKNNIVFERENMKRKLTNMFLPIVSSRLLLVKKSSVRLHITVSGDVTFRDFRTEAPVLNSELHTTKGKHTRKKNSVAFSPRANYTD
jgi:hypothetical protein